MGKKWQKRPPEKIQLFGISYLKNKIKCSLILLKPEFPKPCHQKCLQAAFKTYTTYLYFEVCNNKFRRAFPLMGSYQKRIYLNYSNQCFNPSAIEAREFIESFDKPPMNR